MARFALALPVKSLTQENFSIIKAAAFLLASFCKCFSSEILHCSANYVMYLVWLITGCGLSPQHALDTEHQRRRRGYHRSRQLIVPWQPQAPRHAELLQMTHTVVRKTGDVNLLVFILFVSCPVFFLITVGKSEFAVLAFLLLNFLFQFLQLSHFLFDEVCLFTSILGLL